jgi:uncharacterized protein
MLIDFSVTNYRSIKNKQALSMEASESLDNEQNNVFTVELASGETLRLLRSAVIYGANASGKSNIILAFGELLDFIQDSTDLKLGENIPYYDPFRLDVDTKESYTEYELNFIGEDILRYRYNLAFDKKEVYYEQLTLIWQGLFHLIFRRQNNEITFGDEFEQKTADTSIIPNQLFLSKAANSGDEQMGRIYTHLVRMNAFEDVGRKANMKHITIRIADLKPDFRQRLAKLLAVADTKIDGLEVNVYSEEDFSFPPSLNENEKLRFIEDNRYAVFTSHGFYRKGKEVQKVMFPLEIESAGTQVLFTLGGLMLTKLDMGETLFYDELDNSLHPDLVRFLVQLFNHPVSNPRNAQLIFATHETTLLRNDLFRRDQIWFTQKNKKGESELFSFADVEGLPEHGSLQDWYLSGKVGGIPHIKAIEFIFGNTSQPVTS